MSGLSSGAKLELIVQSRSPSVVTVALQLPESESKDALGRRLVEKLPSTTTLWLMLRRFETGSDDGAPRPSRNFTARGITRLNDGSSGAGRLYYETPVLQYMQRELSSFVDLQKTLAQLGFNSGSALFRLSFGATDQPLEEAMAEIDRYFLSFETDAKAGAHSEGAGHLESAPDPHKPDAVMEDVGGTTAPDTLADATETVEAYAETTPAADAFVAADASKVDEQVPSDQAVMGPDQRLISVFAAPSSTTPQAARRRSQNFLPASPRESTLESQRQTTDSSTDEFNEADYEPTIDHAKHHQSRLSKSGQNRRLPSEAEIKEQAEAVCRRLSSVREVELKIRFPNQTQVVSKFGAADTAKSLYGFVRSMIRYPDEPFTLSHPSSKGGARIIPAPAPATFPFSSSTFTSSPAHNARSSHPPSEAADPPSSSFSSPPPSSPRLILDLGLSGRMLINFAWETGASTEARLASTVLKPQFAAAAQELRIDDVSRIGAFKDAAAAKNKGKGEAGGGASSADASTDARATDRGKHRGAVAVPRWLKLPGSKKTS